MLKGKLASTEDYDLKIALDILADMGLYIEIINHQGIIVF